MSNELVVVPKNKNAALGVSLLKEGKGLAEVLQIVEEKDNQSKSTRVILVGLSGILLSGSATFLGFLSEDQVLAATFILGLSSILGVAGTCMVQYNQPKLLKAFSGEDQAKILELIERNDKELKLRADYKQDPYLFIVKHFGDFYKDIALEVKEGLDKGSNVHYLLEATTDGCDVNVALKSKLSLPSKN